MGNKRLGVVEAEQLKKMVVEGTAPEDIAKHFGIAISSVHNWKKKFKTDGVKFPSVRGHRPTGSTKAVPVSNQVVPAAKKQFTTGVVQKDQPLRFIVNGVSLQIEATARSVNISKESISIDF